MGFQAVFLQFGIGRIRNGRVQADTSISGRLDEPTTVAYDRLLCRRRFEFLSIKPELALAGEGELECRE